MGEGRGQDRPPGLASKSGQHAQPGAMEPPRQALAIIHVENHCHEVHLYPRPPPGKPGERVNCARYACSNRGAPSPRTTAVSGPPAQAPVSTMMTPRAMRGSGTTTWP